MNQKSENAREEKENLERCVNLNNFMKKCFKSSKVSTKAQLKQYVGECTVEVGKNKTIELELSLGLVTASPIVRYKNRSFCLTWEDICSIAIAGGLIKPEKEDEKTTSPEKTTQKNLTEKGKDLGVIDKILEKISENSEDVKLINSISEEDWRGGEIFFDKEFQVYLLIYGQVGKGFRDYCNHKLYKDFDDAIEELESYIDTSGGRRLKPTQSHLDEVSMNLDSNIKQPEEDEEYPDDTIIRLVDTNIDAEGCPVNEVGEENSDMGGE